MDERWHKEAMKTGTRPFEERRRKNAIRKIADLLTETFGRHEKGRRLRKYMFAINATLRKRMLLDPTRRTARYVTKASRLLVVADDAFRNVCALHP